jgi:hypothetical protein
VQNKPETLIIQNVGKSLSLEEKKKTADMIAGNLHICIRASAKAFMPDSYVVLV